MSQPQSNWKYRAFYERQVELISKAKPDLELLVKTQYNKDAELLSFDNRITGEAALIEYWKGYLGRLGYIKLISTDKYTEGDNSIFFEATVETAGGIARVYDVFALRDGKIAHHYTGLLSFTPKASS